MPCGTKNSTKMPSSAAEATPTMNESLASLIDAVLEKYFAGADLSSREHVSHMEQQFDSLQFELSSPKEETRALRTDHSVLLKHTEKLERTTASLSDSASAAVLKLPDLEDRSRRNNICIHGLPEGYEGANAVQYLSNQLHRWFPSLAESTPEIMRAHRIGPPRSGGSKPRVLIMLCLRYTDRACIMKAITDTPVEVAGKEICCTADFSTFTRGRRKACYPVMEKARQAGFQAFLIFPATIKLSKGHEHNSFDDPSKAVNFLDNQNKG